MHIEPPKSIQKSLTYVSAGWAKNLSTGVAILSAVSGATFLGGPLLHQFVSPGLASRFQALSALLTIVLSTVAAQESGRAQKGRINARGLVYTPKGKPGCNADAPPVVIPTTQVEQDRLLEVMPYVEGYGSIESVYNEVIARQNHDQPQA